MLGHRQASDSPPFDALTVGCIPLGQATGMTPYYRNSPPPASGLAASSWEPARPARTRSGGVTDVRSRETPELSLPEGSSRVSANFAHVSRGGLALVVAALLRCR